jgi:hypothetical protein
MMMGSDAAIIVQDALKSRRLKIDDRSLGILSRIRLLGGWVNTSSCCSSRFGRIRLTTSAHLRIGAEDRNHSYHLRSLCIYERLLMTATHARLESLSVAVPMEVVM